MFGQRPLRQFIAVAEELSFRRAAERLHMSQPPLTQAIRRMESQLGVQLFERSRSHVRLTPAGATLLDEARRLLAQTEAMIGAVRRAEDGMASHLRVSFVPSVGARLLPDIVQAFRQEHPDVHLELAAQTTSQQIEALRRGTVDVGVVVARTEPADGGDLRFEPLTRAEVVAALPAGHRLARRKRLRLAELADEPFVLLPTAQAPAFLATIFAACHRAGFVPRVVQEASPVHAVLAMVACGVGASLVPQAAAGGRPEAVAFVALSDRPRLSYELSIAWSRAGRAPALQAFLAIAREQARRGSGMPFASKAPSKSGTSRSSTMSSPGGRRARRTTERTDSRCKDARSPC